MKILLALILLASSAIAADLTVPACRVSVSDGGGVYSHGSGVLIGDADDRSWVLTNWHVVRERASDEVTLTFGGKGFRGRVLRTNQTYDVALIEAEPIGIEPVPFAADYPKPGEVAIAGGFGPENRWRAISGKVVGYYSPDGGRTGDTLAISGAVRQGDSGGPIVNEAGELVAVLWGTDGQEVMGTQVNRLAVLCQSFGCAPCQGDACGRGWCPPQYNRPRSGYARPQQPSRPIQTTPVAPTRPSQPSQPVSQPKACQCDPAKLKAEILAEIKADVSLRGPAGKDGLDGKDGERGPAGPATEIDYERLADAVASKVKPDESSVDVDVLAAEVIKRLPPRPVYFEIKPRKR